MIYRILVEGPEGFEPTGDTFEGTAEQVSAFLDEMRDTTGVCHAAELIGEDENDG